jgi:hypothetical protein
VSYVRLVTEHAEQLICIVRDAEGSERFRSDDLAACRIQADRLGVGATVEVFCVVYRVTDASLSDDYDLFND